MGIQRQADRPFFDRRGELDALDGFWSARAAQCVPVVGRRRVGKTYMLEHFAAGKRHAYYRCTLKGSDEQLAALGAALADALGDPIVSAQPPSSWGTVFAALDRLAGEGRFLLILDEIPYWVAKDD